MGTHFHALVAYYAFVFWQDFLIPFGAPPLHE